MTLLLSYFNLRISASIEKIIVLMKMHIDAFLCYLFCFDYVMDDFCVDWA